jgi:chromosome segregation ATPase
MDDWQQKFEQEARARAEEQRLHALSTQTFEARVAEARAELERVSRLRAEESRLHELSARRCVVQLRALGSNAEHERVARELVEREEEAAAARGEAQKEAARAEELRARVAELKKALEEAAQARAALSKQLLEAVQLRESAVKQRQAAETRIRELESQTHARDLDLVSRDSAFGQLKIRLGEREAELRAVQKELDETLEKHYQTALLNAHYLREHDEMKAEVTRVREDLRSREELQATARAATSEAEHLRRQVAELSARNRAAGDQLAAYEREFAEHEQRRGEHEALKRRAAEMEARLREFDEVRARLEDVTRERDVLRREAKETMSLRRGDSLQSLDEEAGLDDATLIGRLRETVKKLRDDQKKLKKELAAKDAECDVHIANLAHNRARFGAEMNALRDFIKQARDMRELRAMIEDYERQKTERR